MVILCEKCRERIVQKEYIMMNGWNEIKVNGKEHYICKECAEEFKRFMNFFEETQAQDTVHIDYSDVKRSW